METIDIISFKKPAKLCLNWLIECMGLQAWQRRRGKLKQSISTIEENIKIDLVPLEWKLFNTPATDKISWYMFLVDILGVEKTSDDPFESHRIYPIFAAIGDQLEKLKAVPNVNGVITKLLSSKHNQPDNFLFELIVASHYLRNGYEVSFIEEHPQLQTPDLKVSKFETDIFIECKRLDKITAYAEKENKAWDDLWKALSIEMINARNEHWIDITFKIPPSKVKPDKIIKAFHELTKPSAHTKANFETTEFNVTTHTINRQDIEKHFLTYSVRANSPQIHALIFGDVNPNEKRSTATIPTEISRPGHPGAVLNIFLEGITKCAGAQWRCTCPESVDKRSKHFKTIIKNAANQIPPKSLGIIHTFYETSEGVDIEITRREKLISALTKLQIEDKTILAALIHGVKHYPNINGFEWAETIQDFSTIPDIQDLLFEHFLLLGFNRKRAIKDETHWEQDALIQEKKQKTDHPKE